MAKIILNVELNTKGAQSGLDLLKKSLSKVTATLNQMKPDKDLTAQIKALSDYYNSLATAAKSAAEADSKAAISAAKVTKAEQDAAKATAQRQKAETDAAAAVARKEAAEARALNTIEKTKAAMEKRAKATEDDEKALWNLEKAYAALSKRQEDVAAKTNVMDKALRDVADETEDTWKEIRAFNENGEALSSTVDELRERYERLAAQTASYEKELNAQAKAEIEAEKEAQRLAESFQKSEENLDGLTLRLNNMLTAISNVENRYPAGTFDQLKTDIRAQISAIDELKESVSSSGGNMQEFIDKEQAADQSTKELSGRFSELKANTEHVAPAVATLGEKFGNLVERYAKFYASSLLVRKPLQMLQSALEDVGETLVKTEDAVIELNRVLDDPQPTMEAANRLYDIAYAYGSTFESASQIAANFARAGKSWNESLQATEAALLAMNVAELNATEASDGLLSIIAQFDMETSDLIDVVDKLNKTADKNPVSTQKLLQAIQRAGSAAKNANVSFDQTLGLITAISEATNRGGQNIGTAINSLIQYSTKNVDVFATLSKESEEMVEKFKLGLVSIVDVWNQVAKDIHNDKEARDNIITALGTDDLEELSSTLHDELGDLVSEIDGVYNVANTYRKNYFIALLDNMDRYMKVQEQLTDYQGYSQTENEKYMETYTAKVNQLNDAWQKLANDEQGVLAFKKLLVEVGIGAVNLIDDMGGIAIAVTEISTAVGLVISLAKAGSVAKKILEIKANLMGVEAQTVATTVAVRGLSTAFSLLSVGASILIGIITLVAAYNRNMEQSRQKTIETAEAHKADAIELKNLSDRYKELSPDSDEYREIEDRIVELLGEKAELLPSVTKGTDDYRKAVENLTEAQLAQYKMEQEAARKAAKDSLESDANGIHGHTRWSAESKFYDAAWENAGLGLGERLSADQILEYYDKLIAKQEELAISREKLIASGDMTGAEKLFKQWEENGKQIAAVSEKVNQYRSTIESAAETEKILAEGSPIGLHIWEINKAAEEAGETIKDVSEMTEEELGAVAEKVSGSVGAVKEASNAIKTVTEAQKEYAETGTLTLETIEKLAALSPEVVATIFDQNGAFNITSEAVTELLGKYEALIEESGYAVESGNELAATSEVITDKMKDTSVQIDDVQTALSTLTDIQAEYDETGSLSIETLQKLLELGDEYLDLLIDEEGNLRLNETAVDDLVAAKKALLEQLVAEQVEQYANDRLNYYLSKSTEEVGDKAEVAAEQIGKLAVAFAMAKGNGEEAGKALSDFEEILARKVLKTTGGIPDWTEDYMNDVVSFANSRFGLLNYADYSRSSWEKSSGSSSSSSSSKSEKDEVLEGHKDLVSLLESELTLMEHQGASQDEQIGKIREIQNAIHDQAEYMRSIGASQEDINKLSSDWWKWQEKIVSMQEKSAEAAKKAAEEAKKAAEEAEKVETARLKQVLADDKARLTLMEKQGKSVSDRVEKMKEIQAHLHDEAEWLRKIGAEQSEIDALSAEWWDWQEKILKLYKETLEAARDIELEAQQKVIDGILAEIKAEEEALELSEKRLAIDEKRADLESAIAKAKIDYVQSVLSDYITALDDAETLESKQRAVAEAREKLVTAEREARSKAIIDAFKAEREVKSDTLSPDEKRLAVEQARQALIDAENNRTTRVYNESTGQWEYQADAKAVQSAKDNLTKAVDALNAYVEEQAWNEVAEAVENGSVSEAEVLEILSKWAKEAYGNGSPEFVAKIQSAFRKAMGSAASPDSVSGQISAVDNAVKSLNDYLKAEAVKELKAYIAAGNTDAAGMKSILDKWLSMGAGGELYEWRDGLLDSVNGAIESGYYDDSKVQSQIQAVENAVDSLHEYLRNRFIREIEDLVKNGTAEEIRAAIEKWSEMEDFDLAPSDLDWATRAADAVKQKENTQSMWDAAMAGDKSSGTINWVLNRMKQNSAAWWDADKAGDSDEKKRLSDENFLLGTMMGWKRKDNGHWYDEYDRQIYDRGGVLHGKGGIKATNKPEIILDPELTAKILRPGSEAQFRAFADAMHLMFERGGRTRAELPVIRNPSMTDSHNTSYTVNGIPIPAASAERYTIAELFRMLPAARS